MRGPLTIRRQLVLGGLWLLLIICIFLLVPLAYLAAQVVFGSQANRQGGQSVVVARMRGSSILNPTRRLQLFGAPLANTNLRGLYAPYAHMRKAHLKEADLQQSQLSHPDLPLA